jgi:hypothetical protein
VLDWTLDAFDFFLFVSVLKDVARELRRRRTIVGAAILALPIVPLWALSQSPVLLAVGAFFMQFCVQGASPQRSNPHIARPPRASRSRR